ncbi:ABC transporter substrate-binding protein [Streptomyces sp. CAU 1734]|uniref:ABC transporter substrate-binding protein n=1 Tax=Streptomyces sp. CAU 1734 TaxID=3140360 RepID=UPI0032614811
MGVSRSARPAVLLAVLLLLVTGCVSTGDGGGGDGSRAKVRIALDWTPNSNHLGLYAAQQQRWYEEAGLDVEILPYNNASADTLVAQGTADFGISFQDTFTFARASGADITSVMAIVQHWTTMIAVRADRKDIVTPRDLDGTVYGGFGAPYEEPKMRAVIKDAGGKGDFTTVVLGTSVYEALYAGKVDFTEPFATWEVIEAELRGKPLKTFAYTDHGFPDAYNVLLVGNSSWLRKNRDTATAFVRATQRGYELAAKDPDRAGELLEKANPGAFSSKELIRRSGRLLARYLRDEKGAVGTQTLAKWRGYSGFLYDSGVLTGPDGAKVTKRPDFSRWFTNEYLAR